MAASRKLRIGQFSLLSLFIGLTLSSIACGVVAYRQMREAYTVDIVERFNAALDNEQYELAISVADEMQREFPKAPVTEALIWKAQFARAHTTGNWEEYRELYDRNCFRCGTFEDSNLP